MVEQIHQPLNQTHPNAGFSQYVSFFVLLAVKHWLVLRKSCVQRGNSRILELKLKPLYKIDQNRVNST